VKLIAYKGQTEEGSEDQLKQIKMKKFS